MAITEHKQPARILLAGCGNLGGTIASDLAASHTVFGLRRNTNKIPADVHPITADLLNPEQLNSAMPEQLDIVIYCLTPASYDEASYEKAFVTGLTNLIDALDKQPIKRLIFISSSSVYSQDDDSWVDETSATEPARYSGKAIQRGEQRALSSGHPATIVRFSGIYGPSRKRFLDAVMRGEMAPASPAPYSNRIHEADAAAAVCHLVNRTLNNEPVEDCYLASDCEPARLDEMVAWVREQLLCEPPQQDARKGGRAGSKRCSNKRLLASGFQFRYPDFRSGYGEMIRQKT